MRFTRWTAAALALALAYALGRSAGVRHAQEARARGYEAGYFEGRRHG